MDGGEAGAPVKRRAADAGDGAGDFDGSEAGAPVKRPLSDAGDGVGDFDGGEAGTILKCGASDASDGIGNFDGSEAETSGKRVTSDTGDGVSRAPVSDGCRDDNGRKIGRTIDYFAGFVLFRAVVGEAVLCEFVGEHRLRRKEEEREEGD